MRRRARIDANQPEIVKALRDMGASVEPRLARVGGGVPDLLVGYKGENFLFQVKDGSKPASATALTSLENEWHIKWKGQVMIVFDPQGAVNYLRALVGERV